MSLDKVENEMKILGPWPYAPVSFTNREILPCRLKGHSENSIGQKISFHAGLRNKIDNIRAYTRCTQCISSLFSGYSYEFIFTYSLM